MSNTQGLQTSSDQKRKSQLLAQQKQVQQRQILAMMGIGQWVRPDSTTLSIVEVESQLAASALVNEKQPIAFDKHKALSAKLPVDIEQDTLVNSYDNDLSQGIDPSDDQREPVKPSQLIEYPIEASVEIISASANTDSNTLTNLEPLGSSESIVTPEDTAEFVKVAPFDLQGGRYGNWVLMVDIQALTNESQKLWQNIIQALSLDCETSSFPICVGMDTAELANASFAGYVFRIAQSEDIQIAALTDLAKGLEHPNLKDVPTLDAMLEDSMLKRQLWQQISS